MMYALTLLAWIVATLIVGTILCAIAMAIAGGADAEPKPAKPKRKHLAECAERMAGGKRVA